VSGEARVPGVERGTVVGGYTVTRWLGAGGWGCVYLAELDGQPYALKFVPHARMRRWGEREASILLRLQHLEHPHVVRLVAYTQWPVAAPCWHVIVMEYVPGRDLRRWAEEENPTARQAAAVVRDVARGLAAVHREKVVHRDVKGENVVVRDADGRGVLVDFGVGGYEGAPSLTPFVLPPGTPEYQAPEAWRYLQAQQGRPAARYVPGPGDDLWALGVTLYRLLTDELPFQPQTELDLGEEILTHEPSAPHALNPRVPEALSRVCQRLLEKQPEARYADAAVLAAVLEEALAGADAAWDVPLCEGYGPSTATTEGREEVVRRGDEVGWDAWVHEAALPPRRGRKPAVREHGDVPLLEDARARPVDTPTLTPPESLEAPAPALVAVPPTETGAIPDVPRTVADAFTSRRAGGPISRGGGKRGVALLAMVAAAWSVFLLVPGHEAPAPRVPRADQEVALQCLPPDAGSAALPPQAEALPAAVAPGVAPIKDGALVKKTLPPASSVTAPVKQALGVAGLCLTLACASSSPQVRPPPEPEDCPARSLKAMEALDIDLDEQLVARFVGGGGVGTFLDVRQGHWKVELVDGASKKFRGKTVLSCYLTLSDRVYGRCPSARTLDGTTHPVCFELLYANGDLGTPREDDSTGDTARVLSSLRVRPVSRYQ